MILPLRTDAPVYHRPWATGGIIVANLAVQIWALGADDASLQPLVLEYGRWIPWQWITSVFLHAGWLHLAGNMLFLWVFGLVVEGKIGWWRFLALYAAIAVAANAFEQTIMLGADGGSIGASGVVYGLIAVAAVWAPENEVECLFLIPPWFREIELSLKALAGIYVVLELPGLVFGVFGIGSALLHLIGAAAGLWLGIVMLRRGWVDCEGWDWFSRHAYRPVPIRAASRSVASGTGSAASRAGNATATAHARGEPSRAAAPALPDAAWRIPGESATSVFTAAVAGADFDGALRVHETCRAEERSSLPRSDRLRLVHALLERDRVDDARPVVAGLLHDDPADPEAGLAEAELLVRDGRPTRACEVLAAIAPQLEGEEQRRAHARLTTQAEDLRATGALEFGD